ncbi:hypothetical protein MKW94_006952 [Papaver nudicaule]|uniref:Alpha/beta hydrolase fold-3 domain-containing protein n=1 Tax=Papaver nudicaule TaxID=74823 RepID=A0AA41VG95_PAPNU|nr:hypothetical protein [Papaver nudicaule]
MSDTTGSPILPWKTRIALSILSRVTDFTRRDNGTVNRSLMNLLDITKQIPSQPVRGLNIADITVDPSRNLWFRLYTPTDETAKLPAGTTAAEDAAATGNLPVFIFFHGGGFAFLSAASIGYDVVCRRFARENSAIVVSVNYRLAPEFKYPCQYDDGFDVLKFIDSKQCKEFPANADLSRCFLGGDSAGANIAHHVTVRASNSTTTFQELKIIGLIQIQPFYGGEERTESEIRLRNAPLVSLPRTDWLWKVFLPDGSDRNHEAANVFGSDKSVEDMKRNPNFPHTLVVIGGFDPLQDWAKRYYEGLKKCGKDVDLIVYPNGVHAFYCFPELPETDLLFKEIKDFITKKCLK